MYLEEEKKVTCKAWFIFFKTAIKVGFILICCIQFYRTFHRIKIGGAKGKLEEQGNYGRTKKIIGGARKLLEDQEDNRRSKETIGDSRR